MPTLEQNYQSWNNSFPWTKQGDEWSDEWGSATNQWYNLVLPRIYHYLPATHILEIAPGYGRWTQFLLQHASTLSVVDLSEKCIAHCRERFAAHRHLRYFVNNGRSLETIADNTVDFVFSFDSLVHAEYDVICDYLREIQRVLCPGGFAVIHHSNLATQHRGLVSKLERRLRKYLSYFGIRYKKPPTHWRANSVSADLVLEATGGLGLTCTAQEVFKWIETPYQTDCISVFWKGKKPGLQTMRFNNDLFQADIEKSFQLLKCYRRPQ